MGSLTRTTWCWLSKPGCTNEAPLLPQPRSQSHPPEVCWCWVFWLGYGDVGERDEVTGRRRVKLSADCRVFHVLWVDRSVPDRDSESHGSRR